MLSLSFLYLNLGDAGRIAFGVRRIRDDGAGFEVVADARETIQSGVHHTFSNHYALECFHHLSRSRLDCWPARAGFGRLGDCCFGAAYKYC